MVESKIESKSPKVADSKTPKESEQKTPKVSEAEKPKNKIESINEESPIKKKTSTNVVAEEKRSRRKSDRIDSVLKANESRESLRDPPKIKDESKLKKEITPKSKDVVLKTNDSRESQRDLPKEK